MRKAYNQKHNLIGNNKIIYCPCIVAIAVRIVTSYLYLPSRHFQLYLIALPLVVGLHTYDINKMSAPAMSCWLELIFAFTTFGAPRVDGTTLKRLDCQMSVF